MSCSQYNSSGSGLGKVAQVLRASALSPGKENFKKNKVNNFLLDYLADRLAGNVYKGCN